MTKILIFAPFVFLGAILYLTPNMTRRRLLFAVPVAENFRESAEGRKALSLFRLVVALAAGAGLLVLALMPGEDAIEATTFALVAVAAGAYYKANRMVAPFAVREQGKRSVALSDAPDRLPRSVWLGLGPFVILTLAAWYLNAHWSAIPARFPVHTGFDGVPDRWAEKGFKGVYGGLVLAAELCGWFFVSALASWYGARRSSLRSSMVGLLIAVEYGLGLLFSVLALQPLFAMPMWSILVLVFAPAALLIWVVMQKAAEPKDAPEKTPAECWKGGVIYYNPGDPVLFVERRVGFGYTMNFGNPWSWALFAGLLIVVATLPLVLA